MTTTLLASFPSPSQGVWYLGPFPVRAYALFIIAGIIAALVIGDRRWVARGGEPGVIYDIALWAVTFGLIGGRLYHVLTDWSTYFGPDGAGFTAALRIWDGGLGIWGAVALGGVGAWIACRRRGIPLPAFGDAIAPGIILAQAIGRLGNYFNQELYGRETTLPWGLEIYERRNASGAIDYLNGVSTGQLLEVVHPTFLYELLWNLLVFAALLIIDRRLTIGHGRLFALYVAGYCIGRFGIELLRSDFATEIAGVRVNSFTATFVFIGAVVYIMAAPRGREDPATLRGTQEAVAESAVKDLAVGASTTGVVAAATVAAEEDQEPAEADEPAAHDSAVAGEAEAEDLVEAADGVDADGEAAAEPVAVLADAPGDGAETDVGGVGAVEGEEAAEVLEAVTADDDEAVGGVGVVEEDELAEAVEDASAAHDSALAGEAEAEELVKAADGVDADGEAAAEPVAVLADAPGDGVESDVGGVGAVEGEEAEEVLEAVAAGGGGADEEPTVRESDDEVPAAEGEDAPEALADSETADEAAVEESGEDEEPVAADESGGDQAPVAEGEDAAEALAEVETADAEASGEAPTDADAAEGAADAEVETADETAVDESADEEEPVGADESVGDEVPVAEGEDAAEALAEVETADAEAETADETAVDESPDEEEPVVADESAGDEVPVAEGQDAADALAEADAAAETSADQPAEDTTETADTPPPPTPSLSPVPTGGRVRQWLRRRRNR